MPTPQDLQLLAQARATARAQAPADTMDPNGTTNSRSFMDEAVNVATAIPRGIYSAAQDVYGLADTLTGDQLPDWKDHALGESTNIVSGFVEGAVNFATGFIPIAGLMGKAGKIGKIAKALKLVEGASESASFLKRAKYLTLTGDIVAGAVADFAVFDEQDGRLVDFLKLSPALQSAAEDYVGWLQTHKDDGVVWGRVKNVLEGAGVGGMVAAVRLGLRRHAAIKKARAEGKAADIVHQLGEEAAPDEAIREAIEKGVASGDNRKVMQDAGVDPLLERFRNSTQVEPLSLNLDGTHFDGAGESNVTVSHSSEVIPRADLSAERVREFANQFGGVQGRSDMKVGITPEGDGFRLSLDQLLSPEHAELAKRFDAIKGDWSSSHEVSEAAEALGKGELPTRESDAFDPNMPGMEAGTAELEWPKGPQMASIRNLQVDLPQAREIQRFLYGKEYAGVYSGLTEGLNPRDLTSLDRARLLVRKEGQNLSNQTSKKFLGPNSAHNSTRAIEALYWEASKDVQSRNPTTFKAMGREAQSYLADVVGRSEDPAAVGKTMLMGMRETERDLAHLTIKMMAQRDWFDNFTVQMHEQSLKFRDTPHLMNDLQEAQYYADVQTFAEAASLIGGMKSESGRGLGILRHTSDPAAIQAMLDAMGTKNSRKAFIDGMVDITAKGPKAVAEFARGTIGKRTINVLTEYWLNALTSGPTTWAISGIANTAFSIYRPLESMLGAATPALFHQNPAVRASYNRVIRQAFGELTGLASGLSDALALTKEAIRNGEDNLTPDVRFLDSARPGERNAISSTRDDALGATINYLGKFVRTPTGILQGVDVFFKQLTYRAYAQSAFALEAIDKNKRGADVGIYVGQKMREFSYKGQAYSIDMLRRKGGDLARQHGMTNVDKIAEFAEEYANRTFKPNAEGAIAERALKYAREVTLSTPLVGGSIGHTLQQAVQRHPILRFVFPFIRTPMNSLIAARQRLDFHNPAAFWATYVHNQAFPEHAWALKDAKSRFVREMLSGSDRDRADAWGRVSMGAIAAFTTFSAAAAGVITGRGPSDPDERKALTEAGWLPYAVKTPNGYLSYGRLDPFSTVIGMYADIYDAGRFTHDQDQGDLAALFNGITIALANNFTNKSYLVALANFNEMLQAPDTKAEGWTKKLVASFIPNTLKAGTTGAGDDEMRDAHSWLETFMARIPGLANNVRPFRNVLGEPVAKVTSVGSDAISGWLDAGIPFAYRHTTSDPIRNELANMVTEGRYAFAPMRPEKFGVDLRDVKGGNGQDAYDRWGELVGTTKIGGRTLRNELESLLKSARYKRLPAESQGDIDSPRIQEIKKIVQEYRNASWRGLAKEYPELAARERAYLVEKRAMQSGRSFGASSQ